MHWIDPSCLPEARGTVESLIPSGGDMIVADGPPDEDEREAHRGGSKPTRMDVEGIVRVWLFDSKDELRGALLERGIVVRLRPKEAASVARLLRRGSRIAARGSGLQTKHGGVVAAEEIRPDWRSLQSAKDLKDKEKSKPLPAGACDAMAEQG